MTNEELDRLQALCDGISKDVCYDGDSYDVSNAGNAAFIASAFTALPQLIAEVRRLTAENAFLRKIYREKAALNRLMRESHEIAENAAEGPYKDYYDRVSALPDCNACGRKECEYRPRWGDQVRINCPLWRGPQPTKEDA